MRKGRKKWLALFLSLVMALTLTPGTSLATDDSEGEDNVVATIGENEYTSLADAIVEAKEGETVVLQQDVEVETSIAVAASITLNLNGNTITNLVEDERLFSVTASGFTVDGTTAGSGMTIPESNTGSFGFIKIAAKSMVTLNGGTYSGNTDGGAFVKVFHNDELDASGSTVIFNNAEMTSNNRFFSTDTLTTDVETPTLQVTGGTFTTDGQAFGMDVLYRSPVTFTDATVTAGTGPCIEVCGPAATFTNCNFTVTGENSNGYGATAIATSWSGTAEINGGTYLAHNGYGVYVYNSGGKITIKDGTVSGGDAAVRADANVQASSPQQSTVIVEGGSTKGAWQTSDAENAPLVVMGGTHTADVTAYLAEGCTLTENEGTYTVQEDHAVQVGEQYYGTLERAFANAGQGDTVKLLADIELTKTQDVTGTDITLDLNGNTISGSIANSTSAGTSGIIRVNAGASLTITDNSEGDKGTILNSGVLTAYAVRVQAGGTLTLNGGVNLRAEGTGTMNQAAALYIYNPLSSTALPTVTINDANLSADEGYAVRISSSVGQHSLTINGGTFLSESISETAQLINNDNEDYVTINGGTFYNWNAALDAPLVSEGSCMVIDENNAVTIQQDPPAGYIASATTGDGLEAYLTGGNLYNLIGRTRVALNKYGGSMEIAGNVTCAYPTEGTATSRYFGTANESELMPTLNLSIAEGATLSGSMPLMAADVNVTGAGTVAEEFFTPYTDAYEVSSSVNGEVTEYRGRIASQRVVATLVVGGESYNYSNIVTAISNAKITADSTLVLQQDVSFGGTTTTSNSGVIDSSNNIGLTLDLNGHTLTYEGSRDAFQVQGTGKFLTLIDNSETSGGSLVASSANSAVCTYSGSTGAHITIGEGVTVKGLALITGTDATLDVYGTVDTTGLTATYNGQTYSVPAIQNNGSSTTNSTINLYDGAVVRSDSHAIYHPGTGTLNVYDGATVSGVNVGIEMRSGTLNVYDGAEISGGDGEPSSNPNGSGTTTNNAGIAVAQHATGNPVVVNIYGGTISGGSALYESNPQENDADSTALIELNIRDGMFSSTIEGGASVHSETQTGFISGGRYSDQPDAGYIYKGLTAVETDDNTGDYIINRLQNVYLSGTNGNDSNSGNDSANAVKTLERATRLVADEGVIYICGTVTVDDELVVDGVTIERADGFAGQLIFVDGADARLSLSNTTISGKKASDTPYYGYLVFVTNGGTLDIGDGTTLTDNNTTAVYVNNNSFMNMTGGAIKENTITNTGTAPEDWPYGGAGIYNCGTTVISGGEISGNIVTNYGGGGIFNERGTVTLAGDAIVQGNTAAWGGGIATLSGAKTILNENASITDNKAANNGAGVYLSGYSNYDQTPAVFEMTGGSVTGNQVTDAGWGAGIFAYYSSGDTTVRISGGTIEGNQSDYDGKAIAIGGEGSSYARLELSGSPVISGDVYYQGEDADGYVIHVTDEFDPTEPITLNREIETVGITAVEYADGLTPDITHFTGSRAGDILAVNSEENSLDWAFAAPQVRVEASGTTVHGEGNVTLTAITSHAAEGVTYTYQWYKDGTAITGQTDDTLTVSEAGRYAVKAVAHKGADIASAETESAAVVVTAEGHVYVPTVTKPTCTEQGYTTYTCDICGDSYVTDYTEATGHSFSDKWITDGKNHWHECTVCGAKKDVAAHIFEWNRDSEDANIRHEICSICGYENSSEAIHSTGDSTEVALWLVLMITAGAVAAGAVVYRRKRKA